MVAGDTFRHPRSSPQRPKPGPRAAIAFRRIRSLRWRCRCAADTDRCPVLACFAGGLGSGEHDATRPTSIVRPQALFGLPEVPSKEYTFVAAVRQAEAEFKADQKKGQSKENVDGESHSDRGAAGMLKHFDSEGLMALLAPRPFLALTGDRDAGFNRHLGGGRS